MSVDVERALKVGKNYLDVYFDETGTPGKFKCRECHKLLQQDVSRGYQTLKVHAQTHSNYKTQMERYLLSQMEGYKGPMFSYVREVSTKARNIYGWIDFICEKCLPFSVVEDKTYRKYVSLAPISTKTIKKYMKFLHR